MSAPPELNGDTTAEILLRLLPDEPAHLVRAALVCKPWRQILTDPAFLRRYRAFHRAPPLLGFFNNFAAVNDLRHPSFFSTLKAASPFPTRAFDCAEWIVLDCRHGRVLFGLFAETGHHRFDVGDGDGLRMEGGAVRGDLVRFSLGFSGARVFEALGFSSALVFEALRLGLLSGSHEEEGWERRNGE
ncbi:hypothetical protein EJB05_14248, partial [Eragrostis curvula]